MWSFFDKMSIWQNVNLTKCQFYKMLVWCDDALNSLISANCCLDKMSLTPNFLRQKLDRKEDFEPVNETDN